MTRVWFSKLDDTPIDHMWAATSEEGLVATQFRGSAATFKAQVKKLTKTEPQEDQLKLEPIFNELKRYFAGNLKAFSIPICWHYLSTFQQKSLKQVYAIPYGELRTYTQLAQLIDSPKSIRAVGRANATNPMPIVIPCHRVIGSDGKLRGFAGGLETKAYLLRLEGSWLL
ncbi:MAG: methylated-DNA--[protein]-cysteine S-methyltransferase [Chloroflexota bacterium]